MRKWVLYNYTDDVVAQIDRNRIKKSAQELLVAYEKEKDGYGVGEVYDRFKPFLDRALSGGITEPVEGCSGQVNLYTSL